MGAKNPPAEFQNETLRFSGNLRPTKSVLSDGFLPKKLQDEVVLHVSMDDYLNPLGFLFYRFLDEVRQKKNIDELVAKLEPLSRLQNEYNIIQ